MKRVVKAEPEEEGDGRDKEVGEEGEKDDVNEAVNAKQQLWAMKKALGRMKELCCCPICYDFYHAPVMFSKCGHTFCSLCVRQALLFKDECPSCRIEARTNDLVPIRLVEGMSALCQRTFARVFGVDTEDTALPTGEGREQEKLEPPKGKRQRRVGSSSDGGSSISNLDNNGDGDHDSNEQLECPVCKIKVRAVNMKKHESVCPGKEEGRAELSRLAENNSSNNRSGSRDRAKFGGDEYPKKRIPLLACSILSDKTLRKKCDEYNLPSKGSRVLRERRLKEYINRYNAECDSDNPKTVQEIVNDVISAENEYKLATKVKEKKEKESKIAFHRLFKTVMTQKQEQEQERKEQHKGARGGGTALIEKEKEEENEDSQQTQAVNYIRDPWDLETQCQQGDGGREEEQDTLYTQLN